MGQHVRLFFNMSPIDLKASFAKGVFLAPLPESNEDSED